MRPFVGISADLGEGVYRLRTDYVRVLAAFGFEPCILPATTVVSGLVRRFDCFVFSGGNDINPSYYGEELLYEFPLIEKSRTDFELALFGECLERGKPVLGICNGMQMMNVALGGSLYQDIGKQTPASGEHRTGFHEITVLKDVFAGKGIYSVNSSHHQAVKKTGRGAEVLARSTDDLIEAISVDGQRFSVGVQWHPERDSENTLNRSLFERFREACLAS